MEKLRSDHANTHGVIYSVGYLLLGTISAALSVYFYPFIFGGAGVLLGILATRDFRKAGFAVLFASVVCMTVGLLLESILPGWVRLRF